MEKEATIAKHLNGFFACSLSSSDRMCLSEFVADYFIENADEENS